jgi:methylmalonyl-CoA epimerase
MIRRIDHIGIVVRDIEAALKIYEKGLGFTATRVEEVPDQAVKIAFLPVGDSELELLEPTRPDTGIARFLEKRGEGVHHVCLEVDDIEAALARLAAQGVELIDSTPRLGSRGQRYAFAHPKSTSGVLIELYEMPGA